MRMTVVDWTGTARLGKQMLAMGLALILGACSTNPATGEKQFTALMPAGQEASIGAQEHDNVRKTFGEFIQGPLGAYVQRVGDRVAANTERKDVQYKFFVVDSPMVNAFALPGGYIYVTRGLLALANSESELAAVLAHEIGHVTARHSAERVSQGFLVSLGAAILSAAVDSPTVGQAAGIGSELYLKSYSRSQEHQADELGVRYLSGAGYSPLAMSQFLENLDASTQLDQRAAGQQGAKTPNYFSTHPQTADRVQQARAEAGKYQPVSTDAGHDAHLAAIDGMIYGDSEAQGFARGTTFYHPKIGFTFTVPEGFRLVNSPSEVAATHSNGTVILFDSATDQNRYDPLTYLRQSWLKGEPAGAEAITINGLKAATAAFPGTVNGRSVTIRVVAIEWQPGQYFRFQMAVPSGAGPDLVDALKRTTYSFRRLNQNERDTVRPQRIDIVTAAAGDSAQSLAQRMAPGEYREERFRVLNGLKPGQPVAAGETYKIVAQ